MDDWLAEWLYHQTEESKDLSHTSDQKQWSIPLSNETRDISVVGGRDPERGLCFLLSLEELLHRLTVFSLHRNTQRCLLQQLLSWRTAQQTADALTRKGFDHFYGHEPAFRSVSVTLQQVLASTRSCRCSSSIRTVVVDLEEESRTERTSRVSCFSSVYLSVSTTDRGPSLASKLE